jgi:chromosome segregation ATPase
MTASRVAGFLFCAALLAAAQVSAQTARQTGGSARAIQQLQQLAAERTALQAENARLKSELETLRRERDQLKAGGGPAERRVRAAQEVAARVNNERLQLSMELEQQKARMRELVDKSREIIETLRTVEKDRSALQQQLAEQQRLGGVCVERNLELYKLNDELLALLTRRSSLAQIEPFTRIARARLENLIDDYRYRADEQRMSTPVSLPSAVEPQITNPQKRDSP